MSLPEALNDNDGVLSEEVNRAFLEALQALAFELAPSVRARLMAFVHLAADPARVSAELKVTPDGEIRLVLVQS